MRLEFQIVPREEVRADFPAFRPYLAEIREKTKARWVPEDIFGEISNNTAFLFRIVEEESGKEIGITVARLDVERHSGTKIMLAYLANVDFWDDSEKPNQFVQFYDDIAKKAGCDVIQFVSPRAGWAKKKTGCKLVACVFEREVPRG